MPRPGKKETKEEYISRFMSDPAMIKKHPDQKQRAAIAYSEWESKNKKKTNSESFADIKGNMANFVRYDELDGRKVLVVPSVMMTEGVHNGSAGPVYYSSDDLKKSVPAWNMKPVVVYHPNINGKSVSACDKTIVEKQMIGVLMNTSFDESSQKLKSELWLYEDKLLAVDKRIHDAIMENKMMEVSTGLFTDDIPIENGEWNGEKYNVQAVNYRPDHLAVLPDQVGACSIKDGAGMPRINQKGKIVMNENELRKVTEILANMGIDGGEEFKTNELSHFDVSALLREALLKNIPRNKEVYISDVFDSYLIYELDYYDSIVDKYVSQLYKVSYTKTDKEVSVGTDSVEVHRIVSYEEKTNTTINNNKESVMDKDKPKENAGKEPVVNTETPSAENQETKPEDVPAENACKDKKKDEKKMNEEVPVENAKPVTLESYVTNAPKEFAGTLISAVNLLKEKKSGLVDKLVSNKRCKFTKELLENKSIEELEMLVDLAVVPNYGGNAPIANTASLTVAPIPDPWKNK